MPALLTSFTNYQFTALSFAGGYAGGAGSGKKYALALDTPGGALDQLRLDIVSSTGTFTMAAGNVIGTQPNAAITLANRVYFTSGGTVYFSAIGDPTMFEGQGLGSGFIETNNQFSAQEELNGLASYQGKIALLSRRNTIIYQYDPDPAQFKLAQILPNVGTVAPLSVHNVGDLDVYCLADNGVRSIRVRDSSNNAILADVGTPIDSILQPIIAGLPDVLKAKACGCVEPTNNRYWVYVPDPDNATTQGKIYVFSYFPSSQIAAWSTYSPTFRYSGSNLPFRPDKFVVYQGKVYTRDAAGIYIYGGSDGETYENCGVTATIPYLSADMPSTRKVFTGMDVAMEGTWAVSTAFDYDGTTYTQVYTGTTPTFRLYRVPLTGVGTHFSLKFTESSAVYARLSSATVQFNAGTNK